ncbi:hypothetical protein COH84_08180 [Neisseria meningitidis]|uniref:Uncharacterized protein n=1 Tax=Neisseria meningitidis TaxID=487 RepID=A0A425B1P2_NEIME|nr:hypothetical protein [Neisseria meningitidis]MBG8634147.1 hypothetical protein [Neisseria meningitidis]MBG8660661.1 hypothetical protein [Neisseria meningitidis]MBG8745286.1 hypothetical protein [Neisseria meningitidis]MBG8768318.1 hypothetical protein [Neisseria meningitidis]
MVSVLCVCSVWFVAVEFALFCRNCQQLRWACNKIDKMYKINKIYDELLRFFQIDIAVLSKMRIILSIFLLRAD